jgi:hypothetical protein
LLDFNNEKEPVVRSAEGTNNDWISQSQALFFTALGKRDAMQKRRAFANGSGILGRGSFSLNAG